MSAAACLGLALGACAGPSFTGSSNESGAPGIAPVNPAEAIARANSMTGMLAIRRALTTAALYMAEYETIESFTPELAAQYEPAVVWNTSQTAIEDEVSIRLLPPSQILLVTKTTGSGGFLCVVLEYSEVIDQGVVDAHSAAECTGGWPEL